VGCLLRYGRQRPRFGAAAQAGRLGAASVPVLSTLTTAGSLQTGVNVGEAATGISITGRELSTTERAVKGAFGAIGFLTLGNEAVAQKAFAPYWRYVSSQSNPNSPWLTRGWKSPYGTDFARAKNALQLPNMPTDVQKVDIPWWEPVSGPRPAMKFPEYGSGGGAEWYRDLNFPD
jgi:hypothetical protein